MKTKRDIFLTWLLVFTSLFVTTNLWSQSVDTIKISSLHTGDDYLVMIKRPRGFDASKSYQLVYFTDATLNSGRAILALDSATTGNCVLIGVGHIGHHVMRRQRDFIPSDAGGFSSEEFAQAGKFYSFMKEELFPFVEGKFVHKKSRVFIGHSFGGLLALYFSMRENEMFSAYFAISPSVWANYDELKKIEKSYSAKHSSYHSTLHVYAGSLEVLNKVLSSTTEFYDAVKSRNYKDLQISFEKVEWANHYSIADKILPGVFNLLRRHQR